MRAALTGGLQDMIGPLAIALQADPCGGPHRRRLKGFFSFLEPLMGLIPCALPACTRSPETVGLVTQGVEHTLECRNPRCCLKKNGINVATGLQHGTAALRQAPMIQDEHALMKGWCDITQPMCKSLDRKGVAGAVDQTPLGLAPAPHGKRLAIR